MIRNFRTCFTVRGACFFKILRTASIRSLLALASFLSIPIYLPPKKAITTTTNKSLTPTQDLLFHHQKKEKGGLELRNDTN